MYNDKIRTEYCICGQKFKYQPNDGIPKTSIRGQRLVAEDNAHLANCHKYQEYLKAETARRDREATCQTFKEAGCLKLIIGYGTILIGIIMLIADICSGGSLDISGWAFLVMFIGAGIAVGFLNFIFGSIFGAISDIPNKSNTFDIANDIVSTQTQVKAINTSLGKDIFGQNINKN